MNDISYKLIKNGISALLEEEENYFKKNIVQSLSVKLNTALEDVLNETKKNIFYKNEITENSKHLNYFLKILTKPQKVQLKDGNVIQINEKEILSLKNLFESLNPKNRDDMVKNIFTDIKTYRNHLNFYNTCKSLIIS